MHEDFVILTLDVAVWADYLGVELSNEGLYYFMVGFLALFREEVVETVDKVDQEIIGVVLLVASKLNHTKDTGPMK